MKQSSNEAAFYLSKILTSILLRIFYTLLFVIYILCISISLGFHTSAEKSAIWRSEIPSKKIKRLTFATSLTEISRIASVTGQPCSRRK